MNIPTPEDDVYDICSQNFINSSNISETSMINYIEFSRRFDNPKLKYLITIRINIKHSIETYIIEFDSNYIDVSTKYSPLLIQTIRKTPHNYVKFSEDYNKLITLIENYLNETIENFTDGKISYLSDDEILNNLQAYNRDVEEDLIKNLSNQIMKEIDDKMMKELSKSLYPMKNFKNNFNYNLYDDIFISQFTDIVP